VGREPLAAALAGTSPAALTRTTREELGDQPGLRDELARLVAATPAGGGRRDAAVRRRSSDPSR
jgi:hypothetical protein